MKAKAEPNGTTIAILHIASDAQTLPAREGHATEIPADESKSQEISPRPGCNGSDSTHRMKGKLQGGQ